MKKLLFCSMFFCFGVGAFAQQPTVMKTAERLAMWKDSLNLTDTQMAQLWEIEKKYNPEFDTVKFEGIFDEVRAREQTRQTKIKEVLTEEQNARLTQMQINERKARRRMSSQTTQQE